MKLKDYKGEYVCTCSNYGIELYRADDIETLRELVSIGKTIYGTEDDVIFPQYSGDLLKMWIHEHINDSAFGKMPERIDFSTKEFNDVITAFTNWIKSLGKTNMEYYQDEKTIIEVD